MTGFTLFSLLTIFLYPPFALATGHHWHRDSANRACSLIKTALPDSTFFPGSPEFSHDISHFEFSSSENATCSVEPSSPKDVSTILKIVGRDDIRSPFAVKSGGHANNVGWSSTTGVQISMARFRNTTYDATTQTVTLQPGKTWDEIYADLEPFGVTVAGGRIPGVGVGLALGGGYSWVTEQVGLTVDNILAVDIVLPNGTFVQATDQNYPDIMFGIRGGLNNFGVVTTFKLKVVPLGKVWGGAVYYSVNQSDAVAAAISNFSLQNTDRKAQMSAGYANVGGVSFREIILFYALPQQPEVFQPFLDIPNKGGSAVTVRNFTDFLASIGIVQPGPTARGISHMIPIVKYTPKIIRAIETEVEATYKKAIADGKSITSVSIAIEPFSNANDHEVPSAFPHPASRQVTPCGPAIAYENPADDAYFNDLLWSMSNNTQAVAVQESQSQWTDIKYINYVLTNTPLELVYGDNLPRLRATKSSLDPNNVMGLTGGFKF